MTDQPHTTASDLFVGGGEMGALMRTTDWSKTKLGPVEHWPQSLKTMLGVVLGSRFPMLLWWGPDLLHLYNDAYRPILRDKHPASLAAPAAQVWAEVWDVAGPMAKGVQEGGPATWTEDLQLFINSGGMAEETYFTFSYSPVPGDDGRVGGLLNTVQETTATVQGERQIRMLHDLGVRTAEARSETEAYRVVMEVLSANELDLPFTLLYALDEKQECARLVGGSSWQGYEGPANPLHLPLDNPTANATWPIAEVTRTGREVVVDDLSARFGPLPTGRWNARPERAILLPLNRAGQTVPRAVLVAGISPHRALDDRYHRFFRATADQVANVLANAGAYEAETKRAEKLAEIDRTKTAFFSNVSHEFRTPLTLILGPIEEAAALPGGSLQGSSLEAVHRNALRLLRLVNNLLDFARIESGRLQLSFTTTDLSALTADIAGSFRSLVQRSGVAFSVDCPPLPEPVQVDTGQWEKIVLNLLSNAFKFTLQGSIAVELRWQKTHVDLIVRDTGCGIPEQELPQMFERFHRVEGARGRSFEGTGIGLSLVQEIVRLHGGTVRVDSIEGHGSTFVVSMPTGIRQTTGQAAPPPGPPIVSEGRRAYALGMTPPASHPDDRAPSQGSVRGTGSMTESPPSEHGRVLVVDDNADMRDYLQRILSPHWHVELAEDGEMALSAAQATAPDLVLTDIMMPKMDGFSLLRALRADQRRREIPVILLSARSGEEAVIEGIDTGADDYLTKPFSARELIARVRTHLGMAQLRRSWARELERTNAELETFSYSVSHDLRAPLRTIDGFSKILIDDSSDKLNAQERHYLDRIRLAATRMDGLIDSLLGLARLNRVSLQRQLVDMTALAKGILAELVERHPARTIEARIAEGLTVDGDPRLLASLMENLLNNAWKYTARRPLTTIEVGMERRDEKPVFFVRDNGVGFNMEHAKNLFMPFQRLHHDFEGIGIGLTTVQRIAARHGGWVWAEGEQDRGATFYFVLGESA